MRNRLIGFATAAIIALGVGVYILSADTSTDTSNDTVTSVKTTEPTEEPDQDTQPATPQSIRIAAMGDMLPHDTVNLRAESGSDYDYLQFLDKVQPALEGSDIVFCNQESPSAGEEYGITGYPSFNAPTAFARDLDAFGCNVVNLANNHIADKGATPAELTRALWEGFGPLAVSGANSSAEQQNSVQYFEVSGKTFAFIAFTDLSNNTAVPSYTVNMFSTELVTSLASQAASNADYVIASAHWGVEDSSSASEGQRAWAQLLADNGVDLILGTGPHVIQPVERIGDTVVFYSIGNFLSTQLTVEQLTGGIAFIDIPLDDVTGMPSLSFLPTYMSYTWTADQAATEDLLARDNLDVYPLDQAANVIDASLFNTTAAAQRDRISGILNQFTEVTILNSN